METGVERTTAPGGRPGRGKQPPGDGQIVVVRPQFTEDVAHVLGNLFQRLYHLVGRVGEFDTATGAQLESTARQLEDFLQLVMDYVAPLSLALEYVSGAEIAQSLARQVSHASGCRVRIDAKLDIGGRLLVDPGRISRAFALLARQLQGDGSTDEAVVLRAVAGPPGRSLNVATWIPGRLMKQRSSLSEMQWAVAERLLETHGGALHEKSVSSGEVQWEITLPLQP